MPKEGLTNLTIRNETSERLHKLLDEYNEENESNISLAEYFERLSISLETLKIGQAVELTVLRTILRNELYEPLNRLFWIHDIQTIEAQVAISYIANIYGQIFPDKPLINGMMHETRVDGQVTKRKLPFLDVGTKEDQKRMIQSGWDKIKVMFDDDMRLSKFIKAVDELIVRVLKS